MIRVLVQREDFDTGTELAALQTADVGAVASFTGIVRGTGGLQSMLLEHYPGMTEVALETLAGEAQSKWPVSGITIIHRVGCLCPGDRIVFVGTASAHRAAALDACAFLIDTLKTQAPFWKKETFTDGRAQWVDARDGDVAASARW